MALTANQFTVIRAMVIATPAAKAFYDADDWEGLRDWLNSASSSTTNWMSAAPPCTCLGKTRMCLG